MLRFAFPLTHIEHRNATNLLVNFLKTEHKAGGVDGYGERVGLKLFGSLHTSAWHSSHGNEHFQVDLSAAEMGLFIEIISGAGSMFPTGPDGHLEFPTAPYTKVGAFEVAGIKRLYERFILSPEQTIKL